MPNVLSNAEDILIASFDDQGRDHDATLDKVLRISRKVNVKLNKDKCLFRCPGIPFFVEIISQQGVSPDFRKVQTLTGMPPPKSKKELQSFLGILNYLSKYLPATAEVCEPCKK